MTATTTPYATHFRPCRRHGLAPRTRPGRFAGAGPLEDVLPPEARSLGMLQWSMQSDIVRRRPCLE